MFGIGLPEMLLIMALALIVVGPDKLPDLARSLAKGVMELKKTAEGLKDTLAKEGNPLDEIKPDLEAAAKSLKDNLLDTPPYQRDEVVGQNGVNNPADNAATAYEELMKKTGTVSENGELVSDISSSSENSSDETATNETEGGVALQPQKTDKSGE
ncbi:MAG: hypothetical protein GY702_10015 [Desulfobulbaceae bacterium]|nr:hypothetical protein [Desulfobulbaceae bacterium]